ncbi:16744_t:CDS:2, partial [Acaulospora colombiana]
HIIPRVDLGVSVLSGIASASVFLQLDGYGSLDMSLQVEGSASTSVLPSAPAKTMADTETLSLPATTTATSEEAVAPTEQPSAESPEDPSSTDSSDAVSSTASDAKLDEANTETTPTSTADIVAATGNSDPYVPELAELSPSPQGEDYNATEPTSQAALQVAVTLATSDETSSRTSLEIMSTLAVVLELKWASRLSLVLKANCSPSGRILCPPTCSVRVGKSLRSIGAWHGPITPSLPHSLQSRQLDGLICPAITDSINALNQ